ncbi:acyl-CoA dehydrogenase family protein [Bacillus salitolerans]|uniref:Acyl-CoA dehydrogenase family protein n=1 Tax=Bacillus salitolerans TaxID=1437434 RepID=A0ABW4LVB9_9BACI
MGEQRNEVRSLDEVLAQAESLIQPFQERARLAEVEGDWLLENLEDIKKANFLGLTVPVEYGGNGFTLYEFIRFQEVLAQGDGATALSIGWHLGNILGNAETRKWKETTFQSLCEKIVRQKALMNAVASERATGSPARGGMPTTKAVQQAGGDWVINGEKAFASMAIALDYSLITAELGQSGQIGQFLIDHNTPGVKIKESWDSISMKATKSDDLLLQNVRVDKEALVSISDNKTNLPKGWMLHIPAVYLGIAISARNEAISFAKEYSPNTLPGPISDVPEVQRKIGEMELELFKARQILYAIAQKWSHSQELRANMGSELGAVKHIVTNSAIRVVDVAMRIVGARSLSEKNPLQRYFRDVRAGIHNPPADENVIQQLAKRALQ